MKNSNLKLNTHNKIILAAFVFSLLSPLFVFGQGTRMEFCSDGTLKPFGSCGGTTPTPSGQTFTPLGGPTFTPTGGQGSSGAAGQQTITLPNPLGQTSTFAELINRITNWLLVIGAPILALMIIIGAFQIMTGAGEPEKITKGRHTITYAIIGYALLLISSGITTIIQNLLSGKQ